VPSSPQHRPPRGQQNTPPKPTRKHTTVSKNQTKTKQNKAKKKNLKKKQKRSNAKTKQEEDAHKLFLHVKDFF
jgi:hypothetical protein